MVLNWKTGFLRMWMVLSGCWIALVAIGATWDLVHYKVTPTAAEFFNGATPAAAPTPLWVCFLDAVIPPAVVLALGFFASWIVSGFIQKTPDSK